MDLDWNRWQRTQIKRSYVSNVNQVHLQESAVSSEPGQASGLRRVRPPLTVTCKRRSVLLKLTLGPEGVDVEQQQEKGYNILGTSLSARCLIAMRRSSG